MIKGTWARGVLWRGKGKVGVGKEEKQKAGRRGAEHLKLSHKEIKGKGGKTEKGIIC